MRRSIKRIVFETTYKWTQEGRLPLSVPEIKQIAGRAGRYRTANQALQENVAPPAKSIGLVTTLEESDLPMVQHALTAEPKPLSAAGIFAPNLVVERFAAYFPPETQFSYILRQMHGLSQLHPWFSLSLIEEQVKIATLIDQFKDLRVADRMIFCAAPIKCREESMVKVFLEFARCVAEQRSISLLEMPHLDLDILEKEPSGKLEYLHILEVLHLSLVCYIWLSYRFAGIFGERALAIHVKEMVEERINRGLARGRYYLKPKPRLSTQLLSGDETSSEFPFTIVPHHSAKGFTSGQQLFRVAGSKAQFL